MSSIISNFVEAKIKDSTIELNGRTTTRPNLLRFDEQNNDLYVVDVDIGDGKEMRGVAVASGNLQLRYAEVSSPVTLKKIANHWTVIGFSKTMPGTFKRVPVTVPDFTFGLPTYTKGTVITESFEVRALTYIELSTLGTYGGVGSPYGALGKFRDGELIGVFT